jgi:hypothetical protein
MIRHFGSSYTRNCLLGTIVVTRRAELLYVSTESFFYCTCCTECCKILSKIRTCCTGCCKILSKIRTCCIGCCKILSKIITCCIGCCKILHWYCRKIFRRTFHTAGVRKWVTFSVLVEIWVFDLNGDLLITTLASVLYEDIPFTHEHQIWISNLVSGPRQPHTFLCSHHERSRLNIYRKMFQTVFVDKMVTIFLCSINFSVHLTTSQNGSTRHHCYRCADKSLARPGRKQTTETKPEEMSNIPRW